MRYQPVPPRVRRALAALLSLLMSLGPVAQPAYAGLTPLADEPINIKNQAKPNIVLTVDDSTSMLYDFLPDYVVSKYCRDGTGAMKAACGYSGQPTVLGSGPSGGPYTNVGQYISPQYIWEQPSLPFPAYGTGAGQVPSALTTPAPNPLLFTNSGPDAGCGPGTCSVGVDPGPLPGIATYPLGSPKAGQPYDYWQLWPAPAHNAALNHIYYNPRLTYDPPVYSDSTSYPQMNAANTSGWTKVRADPFSTSDPLDCTSEPCVDLTANVVVGQWCNSDWTQGNDDSGVPFVTNPGHCRVNGLIAAASAGAPAATGDYMYPWAPTGITPNDINSKVDMSTFSVSPPANAKVKAAWADSGGVPTAAQDAKYFDQNENVLWCDVTSSQWPKDTTSSGNCSGYVGGTCNTANGNCSGVVAGACNTANGNCGGVTGACNTANGTCAGNVAGACNTGNGICGGAAGTCNLANGNCNGTNGACNLANGACNGTNGTCNLGNGNCSGYVAGACAGSQTGSCGAATGCTATREACVAGTAASCSGPCGWNPPNCNTDPDPEGGCVYQCGTCNYKNTGGVANGTCGANSDCQPFPNHCSATTGTTCTTVGANSASCPVVPNSGTCQYASTSGGSCTTTADCGSKCQNSSKLGTACSSNSNCDVSGTCSAGKPSTTTCSAAADCNVNGSCTTGTNTGASCTANGANATCGPIDKCSAGNVGAACTSSAQCNLNGTCQTGTNTGTACSGSGANATCGPIDKCSAGKPNTTTCTTNAQCNVTGTCTTGINTGTACNGSGANATCGPIDKCSAGNIGAACTTNAQCATASTCQTGANTGAACTGTGVNAACGVVDKCTAGKPATTTCTTAAQCSVTGSCTTGINAPASCTVNGANATCGPVDKCTAGLPSTTSCTTNAQCNTASTCTSGTNTGAACSGSGPNAACGAVNKCSAGLPATTACTTAAQCNVSGTCTTGSNNGASCTANGANATCGPINQCSAGNVGASCLTSGSCDVAGTCTTGNVGASCSANGTTAQCAISQQATATTCDSKTASSGITLLADANGSGVVCRRNNHAYSGGPTASQTNYPSGKFTTPVMGEQVAGAGCRATDRYASVPRHYWKTEVEWCDKSVSTAGDKWLGYGTPAGGSCQAFKDTTHVFPRFYQFGAAAGTDNDATAAFARTDLVSTATYTHTWTDDAGTLQTITRTYAEEMTNYANWFAYYRTRLTAVKTVTSLTFLGKTAGTLNVDDQFRVGFHTMFSYLTSFVNIADFDAGQKASWATQLMDLKVPLGQETPTLNTVSRIGDYYLNGTNALLPGSTDPIVLSCQKNWHMFFTDGFTNQNVLPTTTVGDMDDTLPVGQLPIGGAAVAITGLSPGDPWPPPFREDVGPGQPVSNSASDYVTNYWVTNLRPAMPENVATSARDPASWPHQNFAAMSLGTEGILPSGNQSSVEAQLTAGTLQWPKPQPTVFRPDQSGVDDVWHAAINGRGRFVNAQSADELKLGMGQILQDVVNQAGARTGASFQSTSISGASNFIYRTAFQPGWGSSLRKVQIDPVTGAEISVAWDASTQLALQLTVVPGVKDTPWFTDRMVVTVDETGKAVPFLDASIGVNQLDSLAPGKTPRAKAILAFLRGDRTREGTKVGQFRVRIGGLLGDIVDSQPVYVGPPRAPYLEANDPGYTTNFRDVAAFKNRPARIYVGANDGMLHAFDDNTGNEAWAFVPSDLYRPDDTGLGALSYQDGALPPFKHHFYVDSTPRISDVNFGGGASDWHTMLVGGLGKGGKSYYALDISQPSDITSETEAAKRVLWEFTDADMGYTYGRAIIAKTHAFGGEWLVIVPSGYNNATGLGKVFFLRASDGKLLKTLSTGAGTATDPSGLAHIAAYEKDFRNQFAEQIYGGDLQGNFWRFDISDPDDSKWGAAEKIADLTDPTGKPQAVTIPPQIEIDIANGIDRWVFIGTGRLLDDLDLTTSTIANQVQTMYAFRDGTASAPIAPWPAALQPRADMAAVTDAAGLAAKPDKGWYDDLPAGQRIVVPVQAALSLIAYVGTSPQTDPCLTGQPATLYGREYSRGNSLLVDDTGATVESIFEAEGIVGLELVALSGGSSDSGAGGFPDLRIAITAGTPGKATGFVKPKAPDFSQKHRMSWRLLGQ